MSRLILGTRGSDLARAQTALVEMALRAQHPQLEIAIEIITTSGDERNGRSPEIVDRKAGRKGMFTAEIERALLEGKIDVAVHSAKDLPSDPAEELSVCAALPRAAVEDVLITKTGRTIGTLPQGATIATGSVRRQHQLRWSRPDLELVDLRGNVPTRLRKLKENGWAGIVLARAGLERLHCEFGKLHVSVLPIARFLPAGGQGIVAMQVRSDDRETRQLLGSVSDDQVFWCLRAEREFLRLLQGDCGTPVGVLAQIAGDDLTIQAHLFSATEAEPAIGRVCVSLRTTSPEAIGAKLFREMSLSGT